MQSLTELESNKNISDKENSEHNMQVFDSEKLKTYGDLKNDYSIYVSTGQKKKLAQQCNSTINLPLFSENADMCVLEKCIIPELHILTGVLNHTFWDGLVPLVWREKALSWPHNVKAISKNYHGEVFQGNTCRKLLKHADKLDALIHNEGDRIQIELFKNTLEAFNKNVKCCFY